MVSLEGDPLPCRGCGQKFEPYCHVLLIRSSSISPQPQVTSIDWSCLESTLISLSGIR